jgi:hypothetical protein
MHSEAGRAQLRGALSSTTAWSRRAGARGSCLAVGLLSTVVFASDADYCGLCYHWPWVIQEVGTCSHWRRPWFVE